MWQHCKTASIIANLPKITMNNPPQIKIKYPHKIDHNTSTSQFLSVLLKNRGLTQKDIPDFFHPPSVSKLNFHPYLSLLKLKKAVSIIKNTIKLKRNILIYGDYDVDGLSATALLYQSLLKAGAKVTPFIPDRQNDGYGFNSQSFLKINQNFSLLITVDNGIVAAKEFSQIPKNTDTIIVDHHLPTEILPKVSAIVHSTQFSGSILAWVLAKQFDPSADLGLAVLGLVSDCLHLIGINRSLLIHGLNSLRQNPSLGLKKLIEISGAKQETLSVYDLGFLLGPRLNAIGRLASPSKALKLLITNDLSEASKLAQSLNQYNQDRQSLQQESLELAESLINSTAKNKLIFVSHKLFNPGIIGLIASNLCEKYYLPAIAISLGPEVSKGSCRSIKELNIIETLRLHSALFLDLGGHSGAAGFSLKTSLVSKLKKILVKTVSQKLSDLNLSPSVEVDAEMKLSAATITNCQAVQKIQPFGIGNPEPLFLFKNLSIVEKRLVGSTNSHLKLRLDDPSTPKNENVATEAIAFKKGQLDSQLKVGDSVDIIARLDLNTWNGHSTPQLIVKEILLGQT